MSNYYTIPFNRKIMNLLYKFDCGNEGINNFLMSYESLNLRHGKTYVWLDDSRSVIVGYYNIGTGSINIFENNRWYKAGGSLHINYFAMDKRFQGIRIKVNEKQNIKLSEALLHDLNNRALNIRKRDLGYRYITLCSTLAGEKLYKDNGFDYLNPLVSFYCDEQEEDCIQMYKVL